VSPSAYHTSGGAADGPSANVFATFAWRASMDRTRSYILTSSARDDRGAAAAISAIGRRPAISRAAEASASDAARRFCGRAEMVFRA